MENKEKKINITEEKLTSILVETFCIGNCNQEITLQEIINYLEKRLME